jgi:RNA polymerase sigma-70 factor, ECF subfamily
MRERTIVLTTGDVRLTSVYDTEESLERLAEAAAADEAAFERLVRRCYERIHRWALVATGDPDDADDVVQEALVRMHRSLADYRRESRFTTWLYRVTRSAAVDHGRRRAARIRKRLRWSRYRDATHQEPPGVVAGIEQERQVAMVRAFWNDLPRRQRQIFDLVDLQGHAPSEVAEMLELNAATVRAHLFKARRTLRTKLLEPTSERSEDEVI